MGANNKVIKMTEEEYEKEQSNSYYVGISAGLDQASRILMDDAVQFFKTDQDEMAKYCKKVSLMLKGESDIAHPRKNT